MTGYEVYRRCLSLLGYTSAENETVSCKALLTRMPDIINSIAADLNIEEIPELTSPINADSKRLDALCCGCTMLLALSEGDGAKNKLFAEIYNSKRGAVLSKTGAIEDRLPKTSDGGI